MQNTTPAGRETRTSESAGEERSTDDHAWENQLTEEDMPSPEQREDVAETTTLDP
jgi:hypothetical protein